MVGKCEAEDGGAGKLWSWKKVMLIMRPRVKFP